MNYTIDSTAFTNYWDLAVSQTYVTCTEIVLYGVLLLLLPVSVYLLYKGPSGPRRTLMIVTLVMTAIATVQLAIHICGTVLAFQMFWFAVQGDFGSNSVRASNVLKIFTILYTMEDFLLVTNNAITDGLFIYRCYMVWGRRFPVVGGPILVLFATTVLGYFCAYEDDYSRSGLYIDYRAVFLISLVTNVVLMALTAGRIWWIRRDARILLKSTSVHRYTTLIAMILESGAIYCLILILYVVCASIWGAENFSPLISILRGALPQIVNIAQIMMMVRVGMARSVEATSSDGLVLPRARAERAAPVFTGHASSVVIDIHASHDRQGEGISLKAL
ncbi:hypothetical protein B0H17DRAFT_1187974 [Mycena rosella]|uniref:Uncharacterized protein n=1 Tax=Mycena rosella TaxID=1033263 RepID=A0AAD7FJF1_MYCRO|nr:hypothetical protein B0H17DRAFT_1187974 [Mycena rosella]